MQDFDDFMSYARVGDKISQMRNAERRAREIRAQRERQDAEQRVRKSRFVACKESRRLDLTLWVGASRAKLLGALEWTESFDSVKFTLVVNGVHQTYWAASEDFSIDNFKTFIYYTCWDETPSAELFENADGSKTMRYRPVQQPVEFVFYFEPRNTDRTLPPLLSRRSGLGAPIYQGSVTNLIARAAALLDELRL